MWNDNDESDANLCDSMGFDGETDLPDDDGQMDYYETIDPDDIDWPDDLRFLRGLEGGQGAREPGEDTREPGRAPGNQGGHQGT